jgi:hypothetical protein
LPAQRSGKAAFRFGMSSDLTEKPPDTRLRPGIGFSKKPLFFGDF